MRAGTQPPIDLDAARIAAEAELCRQRLARPNVEPVVVVDDEAWSSLKAEIIRLYENGKLGPMSAEMLFEAFPELREA